MAAPNTPSSPVLTPTSPNKPFRFMDLPAELRCDIYEYFVVVGKVFYSPDFYAVNNETRMKACLAYRTPELTLLRVCKKIRDEAEKLYLLKNMFVLPDFYRYRKPIEQGAKPEGHIPFRQKPLFSHRASEYVRNISISLNTRLPAPKLLDYRNWTQWMGHSSSPAPGFHNLPQAMRIYLAHRCARASLLKFWENSVDALAKSFPPREDAQFQHLEIDVTNACCPLGCCRLFDELANLVLGLKPLNVTILGIRNRKEVDDIIQQLKLHFRILNDPDYNPPGDLDEESRRMKHYVSFNPKKSVWDKYKLSAEDFAAKLELMKLET